MKLFYVIGIRHNAIVLANNSEEAISLATIGDKEDPRVLFGSVGSWEAPEAHEIKLPSDYRLVKNEK